MIALLFFLALSGQEGQSACWRAIGIQDSYGSLEQGRELKRLASTTACDFVGITWRLKALPRRRSVLVWDVKQNALTRIHVNDPAGVVWDHWTGVTKAAIARDDPSDGFDFQSYRTGNGKAPVPAVVRSFIREHAKAMFETAF